MAKTIIHVIFLIILFDYYHIVHINKHIFYQILNINKGKKSIKSLNLKSLSFFGKKFENFLKDRTKTLKIANVLKKLKIISKNYFFLNK